MMAPKKRLTKGDKSKASSSAVNDILASETNIKVESNANPSDIDSNVSIKVKVVENTNQKAQRLEQVFKEALSGKKPIIAVTKIPSTDAPSLQNLSHGENSTNEKLNRSSFVSRQQVTRLKQVKCASCYCYMTGKTHKGSLALPTPSHVEKNLKEREGNNMYQILTCKHFLCRNCLIQTSFNEGKANCSICADSFTKLQVVKYHSIRR